MYKMENLDLDATIAPKKGIIDPANRIWILQIQQNHLTNNFAASWVILSAKWFLYYLYGCFTIQEAEIKGITRQIYLNNL